MTMPRYLPVYFGKELGSCDVIQLSAPISGRISRAKEPAAQPYPKSSVHTARSEREPSCAQKLQKQVQQPLVRFFDLIEK
jgi:hypothetical protein